MVKPGSIIGGFIIAISIALQVVTLLEIAQFYWLLFIWGAGVIAGGFYIAGGLAFGESEKMEHFTISGIGFGAILALTAYFIVFQWDNIDNVGLLSNEYFVVLGSVLFSMASAILVAISTLFIVAGAGKQMKGVKPGAIIGGMLISISLTLQIAVIIHIKKTYWLLIFWFIGLIGAIALSIGARAKGYNSTESFVIAGVFMGILLFLVLYFTLSERMIDVIEAASDNQSPAPTHEMDAWVAVVMSFGSAVIAYIGVLFATASMRKRSF
ncbi:MAG: hypothetical protein ACFFDW_07270 [Candidatus Thorarchaeota archaeon]